MYNPTIGTRTALTVSGLATLASANYCVSAAYSCNTNKPADVVVEVEVATTNAVAGNKQALVFIKESLDGTNFRTGPETGSTATDEPDLRFLGTIPMNTSSVTHRGFFSIVSALGFVPFQFKIVIKNDVAVALTSGAAYTSEISVP